MKLSYDVVIATRNRPDALALSIPSILRDQRQLPQQLIVVDASDKQFPVQETVSKIEEQYDYKIIFIKSPKANSSFQRNLGLKKVSADITVFPDDDSIFYPGALDEILRIYKKDHDNLIAGVCAAEALKPPPDFPLQQAYQQNRIDSIKKKIGSFRYKLEHRLIPDPFHVIGQRFITQSPDIKWISRENTIKVEFMTGFRMSYRSSAIKDIQFNELFSSYCLYEDTDASFATQKKGVLVGARNAQIYHHKFPTKRGDGFDLGLWQVLNRCYIIAKHSNLDPVVLKRTRIFIYYKLAQYLMVLYSPFGRDRFKGAMFATRNMSKIFNAKSPEQLDQVYSYIITKAGTRGLRSQ